MRGLQSDSVMMKERKRFSCRGGRSAAPMNAANCIVGSRETKCSRRVDTRRWAGFERGLNSCTFVCHSGPKFVVFYLTRAWISDNRHPLPKNIDGQRVAKLASCKPLL